jgi:hypothetical protein
MKENRLDEQVQLIIAKKNKTKGPILDLLTSKYNAEGMGGLSDEANEEEEKLTLNAYNTLNTISLKTERRLSVGKDNILSLNVVTGDRSSKAENRENKERKQNMHSDIRIKTIEDIEILKQKVNSVKIKPKIMVSDSVTREYDEFSEVSSKVHPNQNIHTVNIKLPKSGHNRGNSHTNLNININFQQIMSKDKYTKTSKPIKAAKSSKYISPREGSVDKEELVDYCDYVDGPNDPERRIALQNIDMTESPDRSAAASPSKHWKKLSNLFRTMKSLHRYETKNIVDESGFDYEMRDYKDRLFDNTIKGRKLPSTPGESDKKSLFDSKLIRLLEEEGQTKKINYKEEIYRIIVDGDTTAVNKIDNLFLSDPEYYLRDENDPNFKFNTALPNGKTLLYIACQEGKIDVVQYLIDKKLNPMVKSKLDEKEGESPLGVAARWNYINIVNLLLEKVEYKKENITEVLDMQGLTKRIRKTLKRHYKANFKSKKFYCC